MKQLWTVALAAAIAIAPVAIAAQTKGSCGWERCFGAYAFTEDGKLGRSSGLSNAPDAVQAAIAACGEGCQSYEIFWNACAAVYRGPDDAMGFAWHEDDQVARQMAQAVCESNGERVCQLQDWICSK